MITAFNEEHFAYRAKKILVDLDGNEIRKLAMPEAEGAVCSVRDFLNRLKEEMTGEEYLFLIRRPFRQDIFVLQCFGIKFP